MIRSRRVRFRNLRPAGLCGLTRDPRIHVYLNLLGCIAPSQVSDARKRPALFALAADAGDPHERARLALEYYRADVRGA
jgi:hypothetical protein